MDEDEDKDEDIEQLAEQPDKWPAELAVTDEEPEEEEAMDAAEVDLEGAVEEVQQDDADVEVAMDEQHNEDVDLEGAVEELQQDDGEQKKHEQIIRDCLNEHIDENERDTPENVRIMNELCLAAKRFGERRDELRRAGMTESLQQTALFLVDEDEDDDDLMWRTALALAEEYEVGNDDVLEDAAGADA